MITGNLQGLVNGTEQIVFDYEVTGSAVSSISTGNILNGNEDGWYTIITSVVSSGANDAVWMTFNTDAGANYGFRGIRASDTSVSNIGSTALNGILVTGAGGYIGYRHLSVLKIYAKSGAVRLANIVSCSPSGSTTVQSIDCSGWVWNNTTDNITQMVFTRNGSLMMNVGTQVIILKSNNFTNGTPTGVITTPYIKGAWVRVGSQVLGSPASSVTFSGLDGDRDVLYRLSYQIKMSVNDTFSVRLNGSSATDYGRQILKGVNTSVSASRAGGLTGFAAGDAGFSSSYGMGSYLIFAKQGFLRPAIGEHTTDISGTTVANLFTIGYSYQITNTNITSIVAATASGNFDAGSQFDLYALRPNG